MAETVKDRKVGYTTFLTFVILALAWVVGFASRLFAIVRFESIIHEFDPWFNYRSTAYMVENGFYRFLNWFDERAWYPLGRIVGGTVFPGLMVTSGAIHNFLQSVNFPVHIRDVCVFLAPMFSGLTAIATYFLTKEVWTPGAGLFAACFIAIAPGYTSRSVAGSYDNEGIAIFALQLVGALRYMQGRVSKQQFLIVFATVVVLTLVLGFLLIAALTWAGYIAPWSGRFYSLWDTGYAKIHIPIIASVSEHQPTTWLSFFFDLHITAAVFPAGLWFCVKNTNDLRVFVVLYAVTAAYFAGVMVRLMLTFTPVVCVLAGIAFSVIFEKFMHEDAPPKKEESVQDKRLYDKATKTKPVRIPSAESEEVGMNSKSVVSLVLLFILLMYVAHCTYVTSNAYSHPSVVLQSSTSGGDRFIMDDFREAYYWLRQNTPEDARVMSWWDYGYQIAGMANRTTLVDNNTWNNSHIALVGMAMSSNETFAYQIMKSLDVDYVLVIFGGLIGYSGDDINKFLWMVRIAEGEHPKIIKEADYFTESGEYSVGPNASPTMTSSIMYRMTYYRFGELRMSFNQPGGFDRTRGYAIGFKDFKLEHLEEAYTTENWLVRIYKVVDRNNRPKVKEADRQIKSVRSTPTVKKGKNKKGVLKPKTAST